MSWPLVIGFFLAPVLFLVLAVLVAATVALALVVYAAMRPEDQSWRAGGVARG